MKRYAMITSSYKKYDREEERRITWLFRMVFKTKRIRVDFDTEELCYYVVTEDEVNENEKV